MENSLHNIFGEVDRSLEVGLYYAALSVTLSLPEICSRMEQEDRTKARGVELYSAWFDKFLGDKYGSLTGEQCYYLRCGVVHHAEFSHRKFGYSRVLFSLPEKNGNYFHNNIINDALNLDLNTFCRDVISAVEEWLSQNGEDPTVQRNLENLVSVREKGLRPYMVGMPIIT